MGSHAQLNSEFPTFAQTVFSDLCFFSSLKTAEEWVVDRPGIAILTVKEAYQLAHVNWIERRKNIYEMANALKINLSH